MKSADPVFAFLKWVKYCYVVVNRNDIVDYFRRQNIPVFEKVVDFQMEYSGLKLTIYKNPSDTFKARLFSKADIATNAKIDCITIDDRFYFFCCEHSSAPYHFVLSQEGEICTYDNYSNTVNTIFSSFRIFIETYALRDKLNRAGKYEHPPYYDLRDPVAFEKLTATFTLYTTARDKYNSWRSNEHVTIYRGIWLDRPASFIHLYADNKINCEAFLLELKTNNIIS